MKHTHTQKKKKKKKKKEKKKKPKQLIKQLLLRVEKLFKNLHKRKQLH